MNVQNIHIHNFIDLIDVRYNDVHNMQVVLADGHLASLKIDTFRVVFAGVTIVISDGEQVIYVFYILTRSDCSQ